MAICEKTMKRVALTWDLVVVRSQKALRKMSIGSTSAEKSVSADA